MKTWYLGLAGTFLLMGFSQAALAQAAASLKNIPVHPVNPNYATIKANIDAHAPGQATNGPPAVLGSNPVVGPSWQGQGATIYSPSDATGAIGTTEYIELVNTSIGVYDRNGNFLSSNSQGTWTGFSSANGDAEVIWSSSDNRFYASLLSISGSNYQLIFGFSKGSAPSAGASDWCFYKSTFGGRYGTNLPDFPKLGQTADFILIGVNVFQNASIYIGSDVAWVTKPAAGTITTCPASTNLVTGVKKTLKNADGTEAATPVPANQTDSSHTGYVVANEDPGSGTSTVLSLYRVGKSSTTGAATFGAAKTVSLAAYAYPPSAPQQGTTKTLETLDARLTNAVMATDPAHSTAVVWTQHTVAASAGGLGSEVRWYEINPGGSASPSLFENGIAQSTSLYAFMGAISPDRNGATHQFGKNMVLAFNTSSSSSLPAAQMISKVGTNPQSGFVLVSTSTAADKDFSCTPTCRWGDYSGASPDPASTIGNVWISVMLNGSSGNPSWYTWNWEATP